MTSEVILAKINVTNIIIINTYIYERSTNNNKPNIGDNPRRTSIIRYNFIIIKILHILHIPSKYLFPCHHMTIYGVILKRFIQFHIPNKQKIYDFIWDLALSKSKMVLIISKLNKYNILNKKLKNLKTNVKFEPMTKQLSSDFLIGNRKSCDLLFYSMNSFKVRNIDKPYSVTQTVETIIQRMRITLKREDAQLAMFNVYLISPYVWHCSQQNLNIL